MTFMHVIHTCCRSETRKVVLFDLSGRPIAYLNVMVDQSGFYQEVFG